MKVNLTKMQNRVDKCIAVFTNIVRELDNEIASLTGAIDDNNELISNAEIENKMYAEKIDEYGLLKNKIESIIK